MTRRSPEPSTRIVQTSTWPSLACESNAIVPPSGDQRGEPCARPGPRVSRVRFEPSASVSQISPASPARSDWNAIRRPSGENLGVKSGTVDSTSGLAAPDPVIA